MKYEYLTEKQKAYICNGCGAKSGFVRPPKKIFFKASCNHHDHGHWKGGSEWQRWKSFISRKILSRGKFIYFPIVNTYKKERIMKKTCCILVLLVFMLACTGCSHLIQAYDAVKPHYIVFSEILGFFGDNSTHVYHSAQRWEDAHQDYPEQSIQELEQEVLKKTSVKPIKKEI